VNIVKLGRIYRTHGNSNWKPSSRGAFTKKKSENHITTEILESRVSIR
jgi:hypothetical protein